MQSEVGLLFLSFVSSPSFELDLLKILWRALEVLNGGVLFTYNGLKFDIQYAIRRDALYDMDFS